VSTDASPGPAWYPNILGLTGKWRDQESFVVLDAGFAPDRFAATCAAFDSSPGKCRRLYYLTVSPVGTPAPALSPEACPKWASLEGELREQWPIPLSGIHLISLCSGRVQLYLAFGESGAQVRLFDAVCDAFFLHGTILTPPSAFARLARKGSAIALQGTSPELVEGLSASGFELTRARQDGAFLGSFRGQKRAEKPIANRPSERERSAIIIGAGLAGTAVASSLGDRGWNVALLERESSPATGASGNLAAVFSPLLSLDDGRAARLSRACFLRLLQELRSLDRGAVPPSWQSCGVLQLPKSAPEEVHFRNLALKHAYPERYVRFLEKEVAEARFGNSLPSGGWFFEEGGWVNPPSLCAARLQKHAWVHACYGQNVQSLSHDNGIWTALGPSAEALASAPVLVLANAWEAAQLVPQVRLPFKRVRGQVVHLPEGSVPNLGPVLTRDGYLTPPVLGSHCLGATYDFGSEERNLAPDAHAKNLDRLAQMLPGTSVAAGHSLGGRVGFRSLTPDRMPIAGALSLDSATPRDQLRPGSELPSGLFCLLGLGSRGLVWSSMLGDFLASLIDGTPSPLPLDLAAPLSPARFASRLTHNTP
jgi:tRNA 5-methylaminomethyl-2-thiouridine biosynthesis bifunctional protein